MVMPSAPRQTSDVMRIDGMNLRLADHEDLRSTQLRRSWEARRVNRQDGDPEVEFSLALSQFNLGYGYSFGLTPGTYETANKWDLSAFGKAKTWAWMATSTAVEGSGTRRGWLYFDVASGYLYVFRGRYAAKYEFNTNTDATWQIVEFHDFGDDRAVAGRWATFNGKVYVPLIDTSTGAEARFHQLDTVNTPSAEQQTLTMSGSPTGGTFTISYDSGYGAQTTAPITYNANELEVISRLRALPGLSQVTVKRGGSAPNYVWTVTLTAAPTADGTTAPPALTVDDNGLTGGSSPEIAVAVAVNGQGDEWNLGPDTVVARYFTEWNKPGVGPVLVRCYENNVSVVANDPMTAGDWGAASEAGSSTYRINAIATLDRYLIIGKQDGLGILDEQGVFIPQITSISGIVDDSNFVGMLEHNGAMYMPHKLGLIRWRIGENYRFVGAEQDGMFEVDLGTAAGYGRTVAVAPYGRYLYEAIHDSSEDGSQHSVVSSLQEPGSEIRGPLTPQMHFEHTAIVPEDLITASVQEIRTQSELVNAVSSDASGTSEWSNPENAVADDETYASASGDGTTSEILVATNSAGAHVPTGATIVGVEIPVEVSSHDEIDTAATLPGTAENSGGFTDWSNPENIKVEDSNAATVNPALPMQQSSWLRAYAFGFAIPDSARILGVTGDVSQSTTNPSIAPTMIVELHSSGARLGQKSASLTLSQTTVTLGGPADTWGVASPLTPDIVNAPGFGVQFKALGAGATVSVYWTKLTISYEYQGSIVDASVQLVIGDALVGDDAAEAGAWPLQPKTVRYGGRRTTFGASVDAADFNNGGAGLALQADITTGEARVTRIGPMTVTYTLPGSSESSTVLIKLFAVASDRDDAGLFGYRLPSDGLHVANDPRIEHAVDDAEIRLSREYRPNRNVQKSWRGVEFWCKVAPEENIPGVQMWASIDDGEEFALLDEDGDVLTVRSTGAHEGFLPSNAPASGSWIQIIPRVPKLSGGQQKVAVELRDITLHGSWLPKSTDLVRCAVVLDNDTTADALTGQTRLSRTEVMKRLLRLRGPRTGNPVALYDPELQVETHCVVTDVTFHRINETGEPKYLAMLTLRKTPYDAE